jgi:hypothetical protein
LSERDLYSLKFSINSNQQFSAGLVAGASGKHRLLSPFAGSGLASQSSDDG